MRVVLFPAAGPVLLRERFESRTDTKPFDRVFTLGHTTGLIVTFAGMPLVLGSLWSSLPMAFMTAMP
ncbi:MAG: hypothetical protein JXB39_12610 [Deltaproteobacteria bacterium]|nr:hypothetical protein [Deltaproteobacteria bacterium]